MPSATALAAACVAAAAGVLETLDDIAISAMLGGLIFVTLVPLCRVTDVKTSRVDTRDRRSGS